MNYNIGNLEQLFWLIIAFLKHDIQQNDANNNENRLQSGFELSLNQKSYTQLERFSGYAVDEVWQLVSLGMVV